MPRGFPLQDEGPGMKQMFHDLAVEQEEQRFAARERDMANRERAAKVLDARGYHKVADCIRAGMRSSNWPEHLVDPGLLLDLLEQEIEPKAQ